MLRYVGIFSDDYFVHLTLLIDIVALAQRPKSTVVYTINGSAVRAFPNESEYKPAVAVYTFSYINMRSASSIEPLHCLRKEAFT